VLEDYKLTSYPACAAEFLLAGAKWEAKPVIVDKNLVTAQAWPNHPLVKGFS
jgi:protease I